MRLYAWLQYAWLQLTAPIKIEFFPCRREMHLRVHVVVQNVTGRTRMAQYLSKVQATAMEPSLKMLLVKNIGKRTAAFGIFSMMGRSTKCFFRRYCSIWYVTSDRSDATREASCTLDGARSFLLRTMKTESRNWKVDSYAPSIIEV